MISIKWLMRMVYMLETMNGNTVKSNDNNFLVQQLLLLKNY